MKINKEWLSEKAKETIFCIICVVVVFLIIGLVMEYILPIYRPSEYTCTDVSFIQQGAIYEDGKKSNIEVPSTLNKEQQQFYAKKFLGRTFELQWFDNYVKLTIPNSNRRPDTYIFSKVDTDYYSHHNEDGSQESLLVDREYGLLRGINIITWTSKEYAGGTYFVYSLSLKP